MNEEFHMLVVLLEIFFASRILLLFHEAERSIEDYTKCSTIFKIFELFVNVL